MNEYLQFEFKTALWIGIINANDYVEIFIVDSDIISNFTKLDVKEVKVNLIEDD